jgi:hypothetical protein
MSSMSNIRIFTTQRTPEGEVSTSAPVAEILAEAGKYKRAAIIVESADGLKCWTPQQRCWWKGILLPKLSAITGYSVGYWENELKLGVMPDKFQPITTIIDGQEHVYLKSITILNRSEMREMIEGAIAYLHDDKRYNKRLGKRFGTMFYELTLPDKDLRT